MFDPDGKYLYFRTGRSFNRFTAIWTTRIYANTMQLAAVPLRKEVASPLAPERREPRQKERQERRG